MFSWFPVNSCLGEESRQSTVPSNGLRGDGSWALSTERNSPGYSDSRFYKGEERSRNHYEDSGDGCNYGDSRALADIYPDENSREYLQDYGEGQY